MTRHRHFENGRLVAEDYYLAGGHVYEFVRGPGQRRAKIAFEETPTGDGRELWNEGVTMSDIERLQFQSEPSRA
jgi:hypothetical protein